MSCTVVSCYYNIKSKYSSEKYVEWISNFLKLKIQLVLFTDENLVNLFKNLNKKTTIHFVIKPFYELTTWKLYSEQWKKHYEMDPEKYHQPELYSIWAEKSFFVKEAVNLNPFGSDYFFWCDIGAFRDPVELKKFMCPIDISVFPDDSLLFSSVKQLTNSEKMPCSKNNNILGNFNHTTQSLVGGLWGGKAKLCIEWNNIYHTTLKKYIQSDIFAGKDQLVMMSAILENPYIAKVITPTSFYEFDKWFFMEYVLFRKEKYDIDISYYTSKLLPSLQQPAIAIIIPLYNGIEFLQESTESIKNQTYTNWKCFIGVNGHGDHTDKICDELRSQLDSRFIIISQNPEINNKSKSLNNIVLNIPEEYNIICLLDVDDKWLPTKLEKQIKEIENYEIIGTDCCYFGDSNIKPYIKLNEIPRGSFLECNHIVNSSFMILRKHANWDENMNSIEDYDLWLKKDVEGVKFYNIPEVLVLHRIHKKSFFNSKNISNKDLINKYKNLYTS